MLNSIAYVGASRANFLVLPDPDDPTGRRRLLLDNGCNLAPPQPGLAFTLEDRDSFPIIVWQPDPVALDADAALERLAHVRAEQSHSERPTARGEAETWLCERLQDGPVLHKDIQEAARESGLALITVKRAKQRLGVVSTRTGFGPDAQWLWKLPDDTADAAAPTLNGDLIP